MKHKDSKVKESAPGSIWSFPFFLATIGNIFLATLALSLLILSPERFFILREIAISFFVGCTASLLMILTTKMQIFRVWLHEFKHAVAVVLSGNKIKEFVVNEDSGYVSYEMYEGKTAFAPLITIAPYFLPVFSCPVFFLALVLDAFFPIPMSLFLGFALGADIAFGIGEIHDYQTDFSSMFGGFLMSKIYLVGFYLFWPSLIIAWIRSGSDGLMVGFERLLIILLERWAT